MKKILKTLLFVMLVAIVYTGCELPRKIGEDEKLRKLNIYYCTEQNNFDSIYYQVSINFESENNIMNVEKIKGKKISYIINDVERLQDFLKEMVSHYDNYNREDHRSEAQLILWDFDIETDKDKYASTGFDDYPGYWNELWDVLIDSTDAETLDDFGFGDSDKYDFNLEYSLIESSIVESSDGISKDIKIPQLSNVDDYYSKVNEKIRNAITAFDVFSMEYTNYNGTYEITELTEKYISIKFIISALNEDDTEPIEFSYGITVELDTGCVVMLKDKIDSFGYLFRGILNDKYKVEKGILMEMTPFEIREEILRAYNEEDYNSYKYNFYISNEKVYLILNGVKGKDYSVISYE